MTMKRLVTGLALIAMMTATVACSDSRDMAQLSTSTVQLNAVHWDEMAAADTSAHVTNNSLIFMR
jgi:Ni/Co efflux regulator RcnB